MSRSYKKNPIATDGKAKSTKLSKRCANKAVRNSEFTPMRAKAAFKKLFCSWNIHDYISRWSWEEAKAAWESEPYYQAKYPTLKEFYRFWAKYYKRK